MVVLTTVMLVRAAGLASVVSAVGAVMTTGPVVVRTLGRLWCTWSSGTWAPLVSIARSRPDLRAWENSTLYRWCTDLRVITGLIECMRLALIRVK